MTSSTSTTTAIAIPTGKYRMKPSRSGTRLMSSIITTKRKSTITAPTYTSTRAMARNSASRSSQMAALVKNASTRQRAACTGLRTVITRAPATTSTAAKK